MAEAENIRLFLAKRGYDTKVEKSGANYTIGIRAKSIEEVSKLLATIGEPGRFIVSVELSDLIGVLSDSFGLRDITKGIADLEVTMSNNVRMLTETDDTLKRQSEESISSLTVKIENLTKVVSDLVADMQYVKSLPWWKRLLGVR